jgi:hypothetical protein
MTATVAAPTTNPTNNTAPGVLETEDFRGLLSLSGPCITLVLPPRQPGASANPEGAMLRADLRTAATRLAELNLDPGQVEDLLRPLYALAAHPAWQAGSALGRLIFRAPAFCCQFPLARSVSPSVTVAGTLALRHFLPELTVPDRFLVLALSTEAVQLYRCTREKADPITSLPGTSLNLREALGFEARDHDLENRSSSGPSTGTMHAVRFGTGPDHDSRGAKLADFYRGIDRGLIKVFPNHKMPLILAGVEAEVAVWRNVTRYQNVAAGSLHRSLTASAPDVPTLAFAARMLIEEAVYRDIAAYRGAREHTSPHRLLTGPDAILQAVRDGRLQYLFVGENAVATTTAKEDLWNEAMVHTLIHHGKAYSLPPGILPAASPALAVLRY